MTRKPDDKEPFSALAFKIMADKYVGTLTFCRVYRWEHLMTVCVCQAEEHNQKRGGVLSEQMTTCTIGRSAVLTAAEQVTMTAVATHGYMQLHSALPLASC